MVRAHRAREGAMGRGATLARPAPSQLTPAEAVARARDERQLGAAMTALLLGPSPAADLRALAERGVLARLLPEIEALRADRRGREQALFDHTPRVVDGTPPRAAPRRPAAP